MANQVTGGMMPGTKGHSGGYNRIAIEEHLRRGTFRPSRHGGRDDTPPATVTEAVPKLAGLSVGAIKVWDELAPMAIAMGTLTTADRWAFSTLCELQATFEQASRDKATMGSALKTERDTAAALRPYFEMFGFTAQSRKRLHITWPPVPATVNPLDKFLNRRRCKWDGLLP